MTQKWSFVECHYNRNWLGCLIVLLHAYDYGNLSYTNKYKKNTKMLNMIERNKHENGQNTIKNILII